MGVVVPLRIKPETQRDLAALIRRLEAQNQQAAWRQEILGHITHAESQIEYYQAVISYGNALLKQMDGGPDAA